MDEPTTGQTDESRPVSRLDIVYIFQAYNRHEFGYDELIEQTRAWAEAMRRQYGTNQENHDTIQLLTKE